MSFADSLRSRIQAIRSSLIDLHDPEGIYFHRACNACLAAFVAATGLFFFAMTVQPLLVIAALCFALIATPRDRPGRPTTLLGSLGVVLLSTSLLVLTQVQPLLQAVILISLGFLIHYLPQFGSAFAGGLFVWVLSLLASAGNASVRELPETLLNILLGWIIVYFCYFWIAPYRPYVVFLSLLRRTRLRLAARLQRAIGGLSSPENQSFSQNRSYSNASDDLDARIVSLMTAQDTLLGQFISKRTVKNTKAYYRRMMTAYAELFESILVLEQSLMLLGSAVPAQLQEGLVQFSQQASKSLKQTNSSQPPGSFLQLDPAFDQWLQDFSSDRQISSEAQVQRNNVRQSVQIVLSQINTLADYAIEPRSIAHVPLPVAP